MQMAGHSQSWQDDHFDDLHFFAGKLANTIFAQFVLAACIRRLKDDELRLLEVAARFSCDVPVKLTI